MLVRFTPQQFGHGCHMTFDHMTFELFFFGLLLFMFLLIGMGLLSRS
jgi:hypothetical protein